MCHSPNRLILFIMSPSMAFSERSIGIPLLTHIPNR